LGFCFHFFYAARLFPAIPWKCIIALHPYLLFGNVLSMDKLPEPDIAVRTSG
jgi:hypothetical protein